MGCNRWYNCQLLSLSSTLISTKSVQEIIGPRFMQELYRMPLKVIIVGAGVAGLATAIGFRLKGHHVVVYERRTVLKREDSGSGVVLQPNVTSILQGWGIFDDLPKVAHDIEKVIMKTPQNETIANFEYDFRGHGWYILRGVLKDFLRDHAIRLGAIVNEGIGVERVELEKPAVILADGTRVEADLVIGADGSGSRVRKAIFPEYKLPTMNAACFQIVLPLDLMKKDPILQTLRDDHYNPITVAPGRSILRFEAPFQEFYDIQFIDHEYTLEQDPNPQLITERWYDLSWLEKRWADHGEAIQKAIRAADSAFKWRLTEVSGLPAWSNANGRVVLVGDAAHGSTPYAGQQSGMCIEDGAVLAELLADSKSGDDLRPWLQQFERIRRPRCELIRNFARKWGATWAIHDPKWIERRNAVWKKDIREQYVSSKPDGHAPLGSPAFMKWMDRYDVHEAIKADEQSRAKL